MAYINNKLWRRIFSRPYENFEFFEGDVKYTYHDLMLIRTTKHKVDLTFFNNIKAYNEYWRQVIRRYCPCMAFYNLYRHNSHAKNFMRIEPNYLNFIMPYFFLYNSVYRKYYRGNFYLGKYSFIWYDYLTNSSLPYDKEYNKALLCVLM